MTPTEAVALCRLAKAACPQQAVDEFTADAWHFLLDDVRFVDAKDALRRVCRAKPFVAPAEILAEVRVIRGERIRLFGHLNPPTDLEGEGAFREWLGEIRTRIADGELTREAYDREQAAIEGPARELPDFEAVTQRVE